MADSSEALDERDAEPKTPMKRLGSTRKLAVFNKIRGQLAEQRGAVEARADAAAALASELADYCRRRAELELDYSRALDKLCRAARAKDQALQAKRAGWLPASAGSAWALATEGAGALARDHAALSALYGTRLAPRLARAAELAQRLQRRCREILSWRQAELGGALAAAGAAGRARAAAAAAWRHAAHKLAAATAGTGRRARRIPERRARHAAARARALTARADHALALHAAAAALRHYYQGDLADLLACMEVGFEQCVKGALQEVAAADQQRAAAIAAAASALTDCRISSAEERARLVRELCVSPGEMPTHEELDPIEAEAAAAVDGDPETAAAERGARDELARRAAALAAAARALRAECAEHAKTLDAAERALVQLLPADDRPAEDYYLQKFRAFVCARGRYVRVEARAAALRGLLREPPAPAAPAPCPLSVTVEDEAADRWRRRAEALLSEQAEECADADDAGDVTLPRAIVSCVEMLREHGLHQQGLFRVSGSCAETAALAAAFARGEDPLAAPAPVPPPHALAALLKQELRRTRGLALPSPSREALLAAAALPDEQFAPAARAALDAMPARSYALLHYITAFLADVAANAATNRMDEWNLAVCVAGSLAPAASLGAHHALNALVHALVLRRPELFVRAPAVQSFDHKAPPVASPEDDTVDGDPLADPLLDERSGERGAERGGERGAERGGERSGQRGDERGGEDSEGDDDDELSPYEEDLEEELSEEGDSGAWGLGFGEQMPFEEEPPPPSRPAPPPRASSTFCTRLTELTPDLVLGLPAPAAAAAPPETLEIKESDEQSDERGDERCDERGDERSGERADERSGDTADTFLHNRDTLRKRTPARTSVSEEGADVTARFATLNVRAERPAVPAKPAPRPRPASVEPGPVRR